MRILIYGAGVLGSSLAHRFYKGKKDVTLLARGARAEEIERRGLVIRHRLKFRTTVDRIRVIGSLAADDRYDAVFVVMQYTQIPAVLPALNANVSKTVIFVGNNLAAAELAAQLPGKTVLFGFSSVGGRRENGKVIAVSLGNRFTVGSADGDGSYRTEMEAVFAGTGCRLIFCDRMNDWLISHAAFVLPIAYACYYGEGSLKKAAKNKDVLGGIVAATQEGYAAVRAAGYEVLPEGDYDYVMNKSRSYRRFLKLICRTFIGRLAASDHAMNAVAEMRALSEAFGRIVARSGLATPAYDRLRAYLPAADGD